MVRWLPLVRGCNFLFECKGGSNYQQKRSLVNVKLKWVKDNVLDSVIASERDLKAACSLVSIISHDPRCCLPIHHLNRHKKQLGLPHDVKLSTFMRSYPSIFDESHIVDSGGTPVPWFSLTPAARNLHKEEVSVTKSYEMDIVDRLRKLLMLTQHTTLPIQTIDQLQWDIGLPYHYYTSLLPCFSHFFSFVKLPDDRVGLKLVTWDDRLAVAHLQTNVAFQQTEEDVKRGTLSFPVGFTRGFGLKRKCMEWLEEWQRLPYTSPYLDASHLDPRTDVSEKRNVGVFHELLHLTLLKKTERKNVSNLRKPLALPQKFTRVFERHPGVFYISRKCDTQTVILREAYDRHELIHKHPLIDIRERYSRMMRKGFVDRSRGLYKNKVTVEADRFKSVYCGKLSHDGFLSEEESAFNLSEYESDENTGNHC